MRRLALRFSPRYETLEHRRLLAGWTNPLNRLDVDGSGLVTPIDSLQVINDLNRVGPRELSGNATDHSPIRYLDVNGDNIVAPLDALAVINALNRNAGPLILDVQVASGDDPNNNGVVLYEDIQLVGFSAKSAQIVVLVESLDATLSVRDSHTSDESVIDPADGQFIAPVELFPGLNRLTATVTDELGRQTSKSLEVVKGDVVADWNQTVLDVIKNGTTRTDASASSFAPPAVSRAMAMIHIAMFDAINGIEGGYESYLGLPQAPANSSSLAAAATAAYKVATTVFPQVEYSDNWLDSLNEAMFSLQAGPAKDNGINYGTQVAAAILSQRANDGSQSVSDYQPTNEVGKWRPTPPAYAAGLLPQWADVTPFSVASIDPYLAPTPPALNSTEYASALDEVMRLGSAHSTERTADQTEIALFWADGYSSYTPPGHWNEIASQIGLSSGVSTIELARQLALLNIALADAAITAWDAKFTHDFWRPLDAIRLADSDGNSSTTADPTWVPLVNTPPFPTYTSGHSTFSGAAAEVLRQRYGDQFAFATTGDVDPTDQGQTWVIRNFDSFLQAAQEAGMSRIYGGIHFQFDNTAGLTAGRDVAADVVNNWLQPIFSTTS